MQRLQEDNNEFKSFHGTDTSSNVVKQGRNRPAFRGGKGWTADRARFGAVTSNRPAANFIATSEHRGSNIWVNKRIAKEFIEMQTGRKIDDFENLQFHERVKATNDAPEHWSAHYVLNHTRPNFNRPLEPRQEGI